MAEAVPLASKPMPAEPAMPLDGPIAEAIAAGPGRAADAGRSRAAGPAPPPRRPRLLRPRPAAGARRRRARRRAGGRLPPGAQPRLVVLRGQKRNVEYPIYEGLNFIGRADEKPVDIDLEDQEPPDRVWSSRQHACISFEDGVADRRRPQQRQRHLRQPGAHLPGQKRPLALNDVIQIGKVQMKVIV